VFLVLETTEALVGQVFLVEAEEREQLEIKEAPLVTEMVALV
jgi:hypothetical protein